MLRKSLKSVEHLELIVFSALIALSVVGGVMRFVNLDSKQFWFDESCTALIISGIPKLN